MFHACSLSLAYAYHFGTLLYALMSFETSFDFGSNICSASTNISSAEPCATSVSVESFNSFNSVIILLSSFMFIPIITNFLN